MPSQDRQQNVRASSPSLFGAIFNALLGLAAAGAGLMIAATPFTSGMSGGSVGLFFSLFLGAAAFLGAGGWLWWKAYETFRRWRTYGTSHLQLEREPVPLGSSLRARLRAPLSDDQPPNGFQIRVAATKGSGDDKKVVWEEWASARGRPGAAETEVPFSLDLPGNPFPDDHPMMAMTEATPMLMDEDTPWSAVKNAIEGLDWTLEITASFDDKPDYEASFEFPVSAPDDLEKHIPDD